MTLTFKKSFALLFLAGTLTAGEFKPSLQLDKRLRYESQQVSARAGWGQSSDLLLVPGYFWDQHALIPVLAELQQGSGVEIEETFFVRRSTYLAKPLYRYQKDASLAYKGWLTAKRTANAEQENTVPFKGLYDYEEYGAGAGADWKLSGALESLGLGLELQNRHYPNWRELGPAFTQNKNYYTKDYQGLKASLNLKGARSAGIPWGLSLTWLGKGYVDNYLFDVAPNGQIQGSVTPSKNARRADSLLRVLVDGEIALAEAWKLSGDLGVDWNASNMNHFDFTANRGVADLYGYHNTAGGLQLTWLPGGSDGARVHARASLNNRVYTGRPIRNKDGAYTQGVQADLEQDYSFGFEAPIQAGFSVVGGANWLNVLSNQGLELGTRNAYDLFTATLGMKYKI